MKINPQEIVNDGIRQGEAIKKNAEDINQHDTVLQWLTVQVGSLTRQVAVLTSQGVTSSSYSWRLARGVGGLALGYMFYNVAWNSIPCAGDPGPLEYTKCLGAHLLLDSGVSLSNRFLNAVPWLLGVYGTVAAGGVVFDCGSEIARNFRGEQEAGFRAETDARWQLFQAQAQEREQAQEAQRRTEQEQLRAQIEEERRRHAGEKTTWSQKFSRLSEHVTQCSDYVTKCSEHTTVFAEHTVKLSEENQQLREEVNELKKSKSWWPFS